MIVASAEKKRENPRALSSPVGVEGRLDGPAARGPGVCLVLAGRRLELTQETNASGRRRRLRPSPETATSGQSPHESNGYSTLDHLPSRVLTIVRREQPVFPQLDVKEVA